MIMLTPKGKYRPGENDTLDEDIKPKFNFKNENYVPSQSELLDKETG